jgi:hypothetical protein
LTDKKTRRRRRQLDGAGQSGPTTNWLSLNLPACHAPACDAWCVQVLAEKARVALSENAVAITELAVLPCDGGWGAWGACVVATNQAGRRQACGVGQVRRTHSILAPGLASSSD